MNSPGMMRSRRMLTATVALATALVVSLTAWPGSAEEPAADITPPAEGQPAKTPVTEPATDAKVDPCREYREKCADSKTVTKKKGSTKKKRRTRSASTKKGRKGKTAHKKTAKKTGTKVAESGATSANWQSLCSGERLTVDQVREGMKRAKDFSGKNLGGLNLLAFNLRGANLAGTCLAGVNLERADLTEANLKRAVLSGANLTLASVQSANLDGARMDGTIFDDTVWIDGHVCRKGSVGRCLDIFDSPGQ